jgi:IS30 family transposase
MGPKKDNDSTVKRKMTRITIEVKKEIIAKHENGVRVSDLAIQFGVAKSTICTILKRPFHKARIRCPRNQMLGARWNAQLATARACTILRTGLLTCVT